jgi:fermentation-respiration switch protein FrsA (DUF1100 family)
LSASRLGSRAGLRVAALAAAAALAASAAALWWLGSRLSAPAPREIGAPPAALAAEPVDFASASGSRLRGWLARGQPGAGALVLAHSVRSSRLEMIGRAGFLHRAGYSLLLFDAQGHGESPGEAITFGVREALDARAAVAWLAERLPGERIGYLGVSQGGAAALLGPTRLAVDALVLEAVYPTLREAVIARLAIRVGPLAEPLAPLLLLQLRPRLGIDPATVAPIEGIRRVAAPVLVIAGERDRHTLLAHSQALFDAAPAPKALWVVPGAAHVDFHRASPVEYERRVLAFLAPALAGGAPSGREPAARRAR